MKTSIFIPMALEYDPSKKYIEDMFGLKAAVKLAIADEAIRMGRRAIADEEPLTDSEAFLYMLQNKKIPDEALLFFACLGFTHFIEEMKPGLDLVYFSQHPDEDVEEASE